MMLSKLIKKYHRLENHFENWHIQNNKRFRSMLTATADWFYRIYVYIDIIDIHSQTLPLLPLLWYDHLLAQNNLAVKIQ